MKVGIISDTHDQVDLIIKAIKVFNKEKVGLVYHLGDYCAPFWLHLFKDLKCKVKGIFGNNDGDIYKHLKWAPKNMEFFDKFHVDTVNNKKICLVHGDPEELVQALFESKRYDVLLRGHNHLAEIKKNQRTLLINPGSLVKPFKGLKFRWTKPSVAIYNTISNKARIIEL
jgi:putative phosphoesterase